MTADALSLSAEASGGAPAAELRAMLGDVARFHGFSGAVYMHFGHGLRREAPAGGGPLRLFATGAFNEAQYVRRGYFAFDPLPARAYHTHAPFNWRLADFGAGDAEQSRYLGIMAAWGMAAGIAAPVQDHAYGPALLNLFAQADGAEGAADHGALMLAAAAIHTAARRLPEAVANGAGAAALTAREMAVLRLAALGRTEQETAQSLALSRRGVQFHLARVVEKLDAPNKTAAVALAVSAGLIRL